MNEAWSVDDVGKMVLLTARGLRAHPWIRSLGGVGYLGSVNCSSGCTEAARACETVWTTCKCNQCVSLESKWTQCFWSVLYALFWNGSPPSGLFCHIFSLSVVTHVILCYECLHWHHQLPDFPVTLDIQSMHTGFRPTLQVQLALSLRCLHVLSDLIQ